MATLEAGHHLSRVYTDQDGNLHLNSAKLYTNESGAYITSGDNSTTVNVGTAGTNVTAAEYGNANIHKTVLTLSAVSVALSDTNVGGGTLIYTFPEGVVSILGGVSTLAATTTSDVTATLNGGKNLSVGVGSVQTTTQASGTLATTQQDIINQGTVVSSTTISVAGAASTCFTATPKGLDGSSTAAKAYLNVGVPTATDIDADATITMSGTVTINWAYVGDV